MEIEEVSKNTKILLNGNPFAVEDVEFVKPGKGRAVYKLRLRNLLTGNILDMTYHSGDKVEETGVSLREMQYLYKENDGFIFMDNTNFEQIPLNKDLLGDKQYFLKEGMPVSIVLWEDKPIDITLPKVVELKVVEATTAIKSATATAQMKSAILETGYTVGVPTFVKEGDIIRVDTRTGNYIERAGK